MASLGYSDGACKRNPGPGGWGAVMFETPKDVKLTYRFMTSGGKKNTTNQEMELTGFLELLKMCSSKGDYILHSDSTYVVYALCGNGIKEAEMTLSPLKKHVMIPGYISNWMKNGWKKADNTPVKHVQLWKEIADLCEKIVIGGSRLRIKWVKGHDGDIGNELADALSNVGASPFL
jgi:ribonuclease HI